MSRTFDIRGTQYSVYLKKHFAFEGKIVVDGDDVYGYCDDIYDSNPRKYRKIIRGVALNGKERLYGLGFFKLSNDPTYTPTMVLLKNIDDPACGTWSEMNSFCMFQFQGKTPIYLTETGASGFESGEIKDIFNGLDCDMETNKRVLKNLAYCEKCLSENEFL